MSLHRVPWLTLALGLSAVLLYAWPGACTLLEYERSALVGGELWRCLSAHLCHWSSRHLTYDVGAFLILGTPIGAAPPRHGPGL